MWISSFEGSFGGSSFGGWFDCGEDNNFEGMGGGLSLFCSCRNFCFKDDRGGRVKLYGLAQVVDGKSLLLFTAHNV